MMLDGLFIALLAQAAWFGWRQGLQASVTPLVAMIGIVLLAQFGAVGFTGLALLGIPWPEAYGAGVGFAVSLGLFLVVERFIAGGFAGDALSGGRMPHVVSRVGGALLGSARRSLLVIAVLSAFVLLGRPAVEEPSWIVSKISWESSHVGRFVMLRNAVDPDPFPRAEVFRRLAGVQGADDLDAVQLGMIDAIARIDAAAFLLERRELLEAVAREDWIPLRRAPETPRLLQDPFFLQAAWIFEDPSSELGWAEE